MIKLSIRLSQKEHVNIPYETEKCAFYSNRDKTFITSCINELKKNKKTICFKEWHIKELQQHFNDLSYVYDNNDGCFYVMI